MARISYGSVTHNSAYALVVELNTASTYTEVYISCNGRTSPNLAPSSGSSTSSGWTITGLSPNTTYTVSFSLRTAAGSTGSGSTTITTTAAPQPPATPTGLYVFPSTNVGTIMYATWNAVSGATQYYVEIRQGGLSGSLVGYKYVTTTDASFTGLSEYRDYTITVAAMNANGTGMYAYGSNRTLDLTAPIFNSITLDNMGRMQVAFSAYDNGSGLRGGGTSYYVEITGPGGSTYGNGLHQDTAYRTFTADAYGNEFVNNATYTIRVTAYDAVGNARATTISAQFKQTRPQDWTWGITMTTGQAINILASNWNSFTTRINQFRVYKGLGNYNFTTVYSGGIMLAIQVNQATNAINDMNPSSSPPSLTSTGVSITPTRFALLQSSLNSIQ